ncbi:MAG: hypothetical protein AAFX87_20980 [Bacteroidota bacterium]
MKLFKKILKGFLVFLAIVVVFALIVLLQQVNPAQRPTLEYYTKPVRSYEPELENIDFDKLFEVYGQNKVLPPGYEKQAILALSAYPELKDVHIRFELNQESAPMEATFEYTSLLGFGPRVYRVRLNNAENTQFDEILLYSLPFDAQVGILAHELGHIVYYRRLNFFQILKWGLMYLVSEDFRSIHERTTDLMPVYHGLGWQIYDYAHYIRTSPATKELYEQFGDVFIDKFYMTHDELLSEIKQIDLYNNMIDE